MKIIEKLLERWWRILAVAIVVVVAGPEVHIFYEGMAILELIGAATFVFMYAVGFKLYFHNAWQIFYKFENRYHFFLPPFSTIQKCPGLICYVVPRRTTIYGVILLLSIVTLSTVRNVIA
jgi:hypothetical protein